MARLSKEARLARIHETALAEYNRVWGASRDERSQARDDRRFVAVPGAQWEGLWSDQFENRPRLEVNKTLLATIRVYNEYRNNRITVDFVPKDGSKSDELADTCDGLFRADWQDSAGEEAGDNAFEEAVAGGMGAFRLMARKEDEYDDESDHQRISFEPIYDADTSVFWDLDAKRYDKSDASHCWVVYSVSRQSYIDKFDDDPATWPKDIATGLFDWSSPDVVYIADYYRVEERREDMVRFEMPDGTTRDFEAEDVTGEGEPGSEGYEPPSEEVQLVELLGGVIIKEWQKRTRKVRKYRMSGAKVLEDCGYIAGKHIPIIPVYGKRWFIDNIERFMGVVRPAKDMARLKNMQVSKLGEIAALSSVEKPILQPEQVAGLEMYWAEDNIKNYPYLLANPITDASGNPMPSGPLAYTKPPQIAPAMAALLQLTETDMAELLGNGQQADKMVSNISGKAVEMIQNRIDMNAFIYMSNMAKSMKRAGEVWLSMASDVYVDDDRAMKSVGEMGDVSSVKLMKPIIDPETGEQVLANDLRKARFDVTVDVGPSFTSRRAATVRAITGMMQLTSDPTDQKVLNALALMNMEGEGLGDVREFYRKQLVQIGVLQPNEEERQAMEAQAGEAAQPDAQVLYLQAETAKAEAQTIEAQARTVTAQANAEKAQADAIATLAGIETDKAKVAIDAFKAMSG
jgi:hypothetical protein